MRIIVDADACPVKEITERTAAEYGIEVIMIADSNHELHSEYSRIITVSQGKDSADIALANMIRRGDIAVTQDYGVASLALGRGASAIGMSGLVYDNDNIDRLMFERFLHGKIRRANRGRLKQIKKRTRSDDESFETNLRRLISERTEQNENIHIQL